MPRNQRRRLDAAATAWSVRGEYVENCSCELARVGAVVSEWREPRVTPILYAADGRRRRVEIPDVMDIEVEAVVDALAIEADPWLA